MADGKASFIVVGLRPERFDDSLIGRSDDLRVLAKDAGATDLLRILDDYPETRTEKVVRSVPTESIRALEAKAVERGFHPDRSLTLFWRIDVRKTAKAEELLRRLSQTEWIERAYFQSVGGDPNVNPADDVYSGDQRHHDAAPVGVDSRWAWTQPHGSGASVGFVDLEQGWTLNHEDLPVTTPMAGVPIDVNPASVGHGTGVMGIVAGVDNTLGIIGVAPTPAWVGIASHFRAGEGIGGYVEDAILAVLASGQWLEGDVLLIEYQTGLNLPAEAEPGNWNAIALATALGMVVIEAAGNGNLDLDAVPPLNRGNDPAFRDSLATIVGAGVSALDAAGTGHDRWVLFTPGPGSNFGRRVDCYAYGENVVTAGPGRPGGVLSGTGPTNEYRSDFGGTSSAAAIVAGVAVVLQGMHKVVHGRPMTADEMRYALSTYGTPQGKGQPGHIGVMPDLKKAAFALSVAIRHSAPEPPSNLRIIT